MTSLQNVLCVCVAGAIRSGLLIIYLMEFVVTSWQVYVCTYVLCNSLLD